MQVKGYVILDSEEVIKICKAAIKGVKTVRKEKIDKIKAVAKKDALEPRWFGLVKGKELSDDEVMEYIFHHEDLYIKMEFAVHYCDNVIKSSEELIEVANMTDEVMIEIHLLSVIKSWA